MNEPNPDEFGGEYASRAREYSKVDCSAAPAAEQPLWFGVMSSSGRLHSSHHQGDEARAAAHELAEARGGKWFVVEVVGVVRAVSRWEPAVNAAAVYP